VERQQGPIATLRQSYVISNYYSMPTACIDYRYGYVSNCNPSHWPSKRTNRDGIGYIGLIMKGWRYRNVWLPRNQLLLYNME